ncbi:hypothetical protein [Paracoccus sp. (in: a-proteobacteria)]|uniref:hypothetical protein n=1 Tax=Paracoccus sp. TaxID=267 RepID=UPI0035B1E077
MIQSFRANPGVVGTWVVRMHPHKAPSFVAPQIGHELDVEQTAKLLQLSQDSTEITAGFCDMDYAQRDREPFRSPKELGGVDQIVTRICKPRRELPECLDSMKQFTRF